VVITNAPTIKAAKASEKIETPSLARLAEKDQVELGNSSLAKSKKWLYNSIFPTNMDTTMSEDYAPTRRWLVVHDFAMGIGNFAVGAAMGEALGWNPMWSGAGMNLFNQIKGKMCETAGFATNYVAPMADKNPRPWLIAGTLGDTAGMVVESCSNLVPGGALLGFSGSASIFRVMTGCMKGAGWADLDMIQAKDDNLGDVRRKHGVQNFFVSLATMAAATGAMKVATNLVGPWAPPVVAAGAALLANFAMNRFVANYNFFPVNEQAVRKLVDALDTGAPIPKPDPSPNLRETLDWSKIAVGKDMHALKKDPERLEELKGMYQGRNYLLDIVDGKPYVVMREDSKGPDRFLAVMQAVRVEKLRASDAFTQRVASEGQEKADRWLVQESLAKTPHDPGNLLEQLKEAGWTTDKLRFFDDGDRGAWNAEGQFELPLEMPKAA